MMDFFANEANWVAISFLVFLAVAYKLGRHSILQGLDGRIEGIRKEIETAEGLRVEAQELLAQYQRKQKDAQNETDEIIRKSRQHAEKIRQKAEEDLEQVMQRRQVQLSERIQRVEENALAEIRSHAAELAVAATSEIINKTLDADTNSKLSDKSIQAVPGHISA